MTDVKDVITDRAQTHGDFRDVSRVSQKLGDVLVVEGVNWSKMHHYQREGAEMIVHKLARVVSGDADFEDHWLDIAGYATRVRTIIEEDGAKQSYPVELQEWSGRIADLPRAPITHDTIDDINQRLDVLEKAKPAAIKGKKLDDIERRLAELELGEVEEARRLLDVEGRLELLEKWKKGS